MLPWWVCDGFMALPWCPHGSYMVLSRWVHGIPMVVSRDGCMVPPCLVHSDSVVFMSCLRSRCWVLLVRPSWRGQGYIVRPWCFRGPLCCRGASPGVNSASVVFPWCLSGAYVVLPFVPMLSPCCFRCAFIVFPWRVRGFPAMAATVMHLCVPMMLPW